MFLSVSSARARLLYQKARARFLSRSVITFMEARAVQRLSALKVPEANATETPVAPFTPTSESVAVSVRATGVPLSVAAMFADQVLPPSVEKRISVSDAWESMQSICRSHGPRGVPVRVATGGVVPLEVTAPM